ncbi:MAG: thioredoxin family protein [Candidatus Abyssobacteria bacterium SURF_5]|uniref:Thioredoxin family protein n=1 Tax=Abyssobacteria bacterium (strain SURF_5) TaxID=2093360 RepID=A0A3A4NG94_ABYX5|nr:MAG: thioredoxin family protein [Candidatus Abyssubacteria bacterium SURF_5]
MKIEIFGPGCAKCQKTEQEVAKVVKQLGIDVAIEHITDLDTIVDRGVMFTPAVFIDGEKKIEGKVPKASDIEKWLKK